MKNKNNKKENTMTKKTRQFTTRQVKVYSTQAECYRDIHEFYSALNKQTGARISPNITSIGGGSSTLEFTVHDHSMDTVNSTTIKAAVDSVSDASDINEFMKVETYEFPALSESLSESYDRTNIKEVEQRIQDIDKYLELKESMDLNTVEGCRKCKLIKTEYFCKMFDDVYDVIADGIMKVAA